MEFLVRFKTRKAVCQTGAPTGCILTGAAEKNKGLRLRVMQDQPRGPGGPIIGRFHILDVGDNKHSACLEALVGRATDADQVVHTIRQASPQCVSVVNSNLLVVEKESVFSPPGIGAKRPDEVLTPVPGGGQIPAGQTPTPAQGASWRTGENDEQFQ